MTLPEGRQPIEWADIKGYPSDALDEAKALRAWVEALEAALTRLVDMVAILPPEYDEPGSAIHQARAALQQEGGE